MESSPGAARVGRYGGPWKGLMERRPLVRCRGAKVLTTQGWGESTEGFSGTVSGGGPTIAELAAAGPSRGQILHGRCVQGLGAKLGDPSRRDSPDRRAQAGTGPGRSCKTHRDQAQALTTKSRASACGMVRLSCRMGAHMAGYGRRGDRGRCLRGA